MKVNPHEINPPSGDACYAVGLMGAGELLMGQ